MSDKGEGLRVRAGVLGFMAGLPAFLGGDLGAAGLGVLALCLAGGFWIFPPGMVVSPKALILSLTVLFWPLTGFLPRLFPASWHDQLEGAGLPIGLFWHPQPWSLWSEWLALCLIGGWLWLLWGSALGSRDRHQAWRCFLGVSALLGFLALSSTLAGGQIPGWNEHQGIGPFPNRNQSGNYFALTGFLAIALSFHEKRQRFRFWWSWLGVGAFLFALVLLNGSRSGVFLFLLTLFGWAVWQIIQLRQKGHGILMLGLGLVALLTFLLFGGEAQKRLVENFQDGSAATTLLAGRLEIWRDAVELVRESPLRGVGLGNFSEIFALSRDYLSAERRAIHPESDYFWWAIEWGVPGLLALGAWLVWVLLPGRMEKGNGGKRLRLAVMAAVFGVLLHGLVDVSAHRFGTLFPFLFFIAMARPSRAEKTSRVSGSTNWPVWALIFIGGWFLVPRSTGWPIPSAGLVEFAKKHWSQHASEQPETAKMLVDRGLTVAPLDYELRYARGVLLLTSGGDLDEAWHAFRQALILEPHSSPLAHAAGRWWISVDAGKAWYFWKQALQRRELDKPGLLNEMLNESKAAPELHEALLFLASRMPELRHRVLHRLTDREFRLDLDSYLETSSPSDPVDRQIMEGVFENWARRESEEVVKAYLDNHPEWWVSGWKPAAKALARAGAHEAACRKLLEVFPEPDLPDLSISPERLKSSIHRLSQGSRDPLVLYVFLVAAPETVPTEQAGFWIEQGLKQKNIPTHFYYLAARYLMKRGQHDRALHYLIQYGNQIK